MNKPTLVIAPKGQQLLYKALLVNKRQQCKIYYNSQKVLP